MSIPQIRLLLCNKIRELRHQKGLKASGVAYDLGISTGSYSKLENGKCKIPIEMIFKLADILEVATCELLPLDFDRGKEIDYIISQIQIETIKDKKIQQIVSKVISTIRKELED